MKKHMKLLATVATLLIAAAGVIIFEACNKKNEVVNNIAELNVAELTDFDQEMISFGEKMKSAQKDGESMPLEEAVRSLTNYQNFRLCDANRYSSNMECFTIETEISVNDGSVYLSDINYIYESNKKQIRDKLATLEGDDKNVYCIISRIDSNSKDGDDAKIITTAYMNRNFYIDIHIDINDNDYWVSGSGLGQCGPYSGQNIGKDAVSRLDEIAEFILNPQQCSSGYRMVLYDFDGYWLFSEDWIDTNSPNGYCGLIDYRYESYCLTPNDMRYYRDNILGIIAEWIEEQSNFDRELYLIQYLEYSSSTALRAEFAQHECTFVGFDD